MKIMHNYINNLPDELLVAIVSRMPLKESARTSALSHRWRYLWQFTSGTLDFDSTAANGTRMPREKFIAWVDHVLRLHEGSQLDSMIVSFLDDQDKSHEIDSWIDFVLQKKVTRLELKSRYFRWHIKLNYVFPDLNKLLSRSRESKCVFLSLKSLRLVDVKVKDEVIHSFLANCPFLEQFCLIGSYFTKNLKFVDPLPYLKHLEISMRHEIQSLEISVSTLVSVTYNVQATFVPFKKVPNLSELTLDGDYCKDFISKPSKHFDYSVGLEKLVLKLPWNLETIIVPPDFLCSLKQLELKIERHHGKRLLFLLSLIKSCPLLQRFRIEMEPCYHELVRYPVVKEVDTIGFYLKHLKVIEVAGYIGGTYGPIELLWHLVKIAPSLESILMEPRDPYLKTDDKMMKSTRKRIGCLRRKLPSQIQLIVIDHLLLTKHN